MIVVEDKRAPKTQIDEITERYFNVKGIINLDRNDVQHTLAGEDGHLIVVRQQDEDNRSFLESFFEWLLKRPDIKQYNRFLFYFGSPADHPLMMTDINIVQDFCTHLEGDDMVDIIWGVYNEAEGNAATAIALCGTTRQ